MSEKKYRIRKLTPKECWRLMGFSTYENGEWHDECFEKAEAVSSNTRLYKAAGNSIVVDVLYHILGNLLAVDTNPRHGTRTCPICGEQISTDSTCCDKCNLNF